MTDSSFQSNKNDIKRVLFPTLPPELKCKLIRIIYKCVREKARPSASFCGHNAARKPKQLPTPALNNNCGSQRERCIYQAEIIELS